jgi:hypothetical protein
MYFHDLDKEISIYTVRSIYRYRNVRAAKSGDFSFSSYSLHNNPGVETAIDGERYIDHQPQKRKVDQQPQKKNCHRWGKVHHSIKREKHRDHMVMHSNMRAVCKIVLQPPMQVHVYQYLYMGMVGP